MTFEEIEKAIIRGEDMSEQVSELDKNCWLALRGLYLSFKGGQIDRVLAKKLKAEIAENYRRMNVLHNQYTAALAQYQENIRQAAEWTSRLCKANDEQEALDIALRIISGMTGEEITEKTIRERVKGAP